jgi:hypothetical protein
MADVTLNDARERVALELMNKIALAEFNPQKGKNPPNPREYYIKLYEQCRSVVVGSDADRVLAKYDSPTQP